MDDSFHVMCFFKPTNEEQYSRFELSGRCLRVRQLPVGLCHRFFYDKQHPGGDEGTHGNGQDVKQQMGNRIGYQQDKDSPAGLGKWAPNTMGNAPVTAAPTMMLGITRKGSRAAKGIAPSVINDIPSTKAALLASRSSAVKRFLNRVAARASPSGGTMPAAMTAAMGA